MRILSAEAMREVDRRAIEELGIPGLVLMENAASSTVEALVDRFPNAENVALVCGPGNNGGDGLAVARRLLNQGFEIDVFLLGEGKKGGDAAVQLDICRKMGVPIHPLGEASQLALALARASASDLVVDALFGTGLGRPLEGLAKDLVNGINVCGRPVLAIDIPSGLAGSLSSVSGPHVQADLTVSLAALKVAHVFEPAALACGEVVIGDLGIPPSLILEAPGSLEFLQDEELAPLLAPRARDSHKGTYGHALIFAGGAGKAGAAIMASRAAVEAGAGLVTAAVPDLIAPAVDVASLESMTIGLPIDRENGLLPEAADIVLKAAAERTALAMGPGLGLAPGTIRTVRTVARESAIPLVLDADGLNAFSGNPEELRRSAPTILTPHPGELGRLLGRSPKEVQEDRLAAAQQASSESGAVVVLKGHHTLIAAPDGRTAVNPTGNPAMASGGSGDVLAGIIVGLLAQGQAPYEAACLGVFIHGFAGDLAVAEGEERVLPAGKLLDWVPRALSAIAHS